MFLGKEKKSSFMVQLFAAVPFLIAEKKKCVTNLKNKKQNKNMDTNDLQTSRGNADQYENRTIYV